MTGFQGKAALQVLLGRWTSLLCGGFEAARLFSFPVMQGGKRSSGNGVKTWVGCPEVKKWQVGMELLEGELGEEA